MGLIFKKSTAQPAFTVAAAITGTTEATQTLTCAYTVVRARAANVTCRWYRHTADDGTDPTGVLLGTGSTYTLTGTDVGNYIRAIVTAVNPAGTVQSTTAYTAIITSGDPPTPPTITTAAAITGTADVNETLTVTADFNGETSITYQWYSYTTEPTGSPLAGADEVELGTASTQLLTASEAGRWIVAVVTATNAAGSTVTSASVAMAGVDPYAPIAPAQYTVPAYDDSSLEKIYAYAGDDLQAKLNLLRPGKCLVIEAGATFTGNYNIDPAVTLLDGSGWAYIITSDMAGLPAEGTRVTAADVSRMPKIQCGTYVDGSGKTQSLNSINNNATLKILAGAKKLRIVGIEITTAYAVQNNIEYHLLSIGGYGSGVGSDIVVDRCYVHGNPNGKNRDGIVLGGGVSSFAIINSTVDYFQGIGAESHGIHIRQAIGPVLIRNCAVITAGINIFICDNRANGQTLPVTPADITITKNYIAKRLEWDRNDPSYAGVDNIVKGLIESKGSSRVLVQGNVLHHAWFEDQPGQPWFHQNEGGTGVWDVDYVDNLVVDAGQLNMANPFDAGRGYGFQRIRFKNNLFANPRGNLPQIGVGGLGSPPGFGRYVTIDHNTWVFIGTRSPGSVLFFSNQPTLPTNLEHVRVTNNIFRQGSSGIGVGASSLASGYASATAHMQDFYFDTNVSVGTSYSQYSTTYDDWRNWKSGNTGGIWGNGNVGYVDTAFTELGHFALSGASQFKNAGTDGTDIGADISAIAAQINASDNPFGA